MHELEEYETTLDCIHQGLPESAIARIGDPDENGCWPWVGFISRQGYGRFTLGNKTYGAHRLLYTVACEDPGELTLDHLCRNPRCVNPDHLEAVSHLENVRRGNAVSRTHCRRGHELVGDDAFIANGAKRCCRKCMYIKNDRWRRARHAATGRWA